MGTIGFDLHKHVAQIAILNAGGEVIQHRLDNDHFGVAKEQ